MAEARSLYDVGLTHMTVEPLEVRGERVALVRFLNTGGHAEHGGGTADVEQLAVCEANDAGLVSRVVIFEPHDHSSAITELDARSVALTDGPSSAALNMTRLRAAVRDRDFASIRLALDEHALFDDRRSGLQTTAAGRDDVFAALRAGVELGLSEINFELIASRGDRLLLTRNTRRDPVHGVEVEHVTLVEFNESGLTAAIVNFDSHALDAAFAELDCRYVAAAARGSLENAAVRARRAGGAGFAEGVLLEDRRQGLHYAAQGRDNLFENIRAMALPITEVETIAVRGERLALNRVARTGDAPHGGGDAEVTFFVLHELNDDSQIATAIMFDLDDIDAAMRELDDRFVAGEGSRWGRTYGVLRRVTERLNGRDWSGLTATISADFKYVDRRPVGFAPRDREEFVKAQQELVRLSPDVHTRIAAVHRLGTTTGLAEVTSSGGGLSGGDAVVQRLLLSTVDGDLYASCEVFSVEDFAAAMARFDDLEAGTTSDASLSLVAASARAMNEAVTRGAIDELDSFYAPDAVLVDNINHTVLDRATFVDDFQRVAGVFKVRMHHVPVVALGNRHWVASLRATYEADVPDGAWAGLGGAERVRYTVDRVTPEGQFVNIEHFPEDGLLEALIRAEELYADDEAIGDALLGSQRRLSAYRSLAAYNRRDWDAYTDGFSEDTVLTDRRPAGGPSRHGREEVMEWFAVMVSMIPDGRIVPTAVHRVSDSDLVISIDGRGHDGDGGEILLDFVCVVRFSDIGITSTEFFAPNAVEAALTALAPGAPTSG